MNYFFTGSYFLQVIAYCIMFTIVIEDNNSLFIQTMKRLHEEAITVSRDVYRAIMDDLGAELIGSVRKHVIAGLEPRIIFDNVDFKVLVNIILQNHRNSDMHWIAHFLTFDRVPSEHLDDSKPQVECIKDFKNTEYLLNKDDLQKLHYFSCSCS